MKQYSLVKICFLLCTFQPVASSYTITLFRGEELNKFAPFVVEQRVTYFAQYPYLYQASVEDDLPYANLFIQLSHCAFVIAYYNDQPIGFITGASCKEYNEYFEDSVPLCADTQVNLHDYYYISTVIILPEHRGKGLCRRLFAVMEEYAKQAGYLKICFICESHKEHPLKPTAYQELDVVWKKLGYSPMNAFMKSSWVTLQTDGSCKHQEHTLEYWHKDL